MFMLTLTNQTLQIKPGNPEYYHLIINTLNINLGLIQDSPE